MVSVACVNPCGSERNPRGDSSVPSGKGTAPGAVYFENQGIKQSPVSEQWMETERNMFCKYHHDCGNPAGIFLIPSLHFSGH